MLDCPSSLARSTTPGVMRRVREEGGDPGIRPGDRPGGRPGAGGRPGEGPGGGVLDPMAGKIR